VSVKVGKLGRIRLQGADLEKLRRSCFARDGYRCVLCGRGVGWVSGQMMHKRSRGAGGSDTLDNVETGCLECHMKAHNCGGKPLAAKRP
jgi:5-methylcytosine-specific restriction endonuclease McrA